MGQERLGPSSPSSSESLEYVSDLSLFYCVQLDGGKETCDVGCIAKEGEQGK